MTIVTRQSQYRPTSILIDLVFAVRLLSFILSLILSTSSTKSFDTSMYYFFVIPTRAIFSPLTGCIRTVYENKFEHRKPWINGIRQYILNGDRRSDNHFSSLSPKVAICMAIRARHGWPNLYGLGARREMWMGDMIWGLILISTYINNKGLGSLSTLYLVFSQLYPIQICPASKLPGISRQNRKNISDWLCQYFPRVCTKRLRHKTRWNLLVRTA